MEILSYQSGQPKLVSTAIDTPLANKVVQTSSNGLIDSNLLPKTPLQITFFCKSNGALSNNNSFEVWRRESVNTTTEPFYVPRTCLIKGISVHLSAVSSETFSFYFFTSNQGIRIFTTSFASSRNFFFEFNPSVDDLAYWTLNPCEFNVQSTKSGGGAISSAWMEIILEEII